MSLLLAGVPLAATATSAAPAASQDKDLASQVSTTRDQLDHSKQQTRDLQHQVEDLQNRNQATREQLQQRDQTIAELRKQLQKLQDDGAASDSP